MLKSEELDLAEAQLAQVEKEWGAYQQSRFAKRATNKDYFRMSAGEWVNTWGRRLISDINERIDADKDRELSDWGDAFDRDGKE